MHILVTGGTGFIGQALVKQLLARGEQISLLCRNFEKAKSLFGDQVNLLSDLSQARIQVDAIINLAGEPIIDKRWTDKRKAQIKDSRIGLTQKLVEWISNAEHKPKVFISGSAIGYYGNYPEDEAVSEMTSPRWCFSSELCQQWEAAAKPIETMGIRLCLVRTGVVLAKHGGALKRMWLPFNLGLGGRIGNGKQWFSWIHLDDMLALLIYLLDTPSISGPVNATAIHPVSNAELTRCLAATLKRPAFFHMPEAVAKFLFGESSELLLEGQKVIPKKLLDHGFQFRYPHLPQALESIRKA